jgi:F-type H+-transporting ATPase subunit gamma
MSDNISNLRRQISSAGDLQSVVRTMKAVAASNIGQYEDSVDALGDYYQTIELGLGVCLRKSEALPLISKQKQSVDEGKIGAVIFGSDQGLVGRFNDKVVAYAIQQFAKFPVKPKIWAVGERVHARLTDAGLFPAGLFIVPSSIKAVGTLVGQILVESEGDMGENAVVELHLFYNRPTSGAGYVPASQKLLPLDENWRLRLLQMPWPYGNLPEIMGTSNMVLEALIHEYLFTSLYRACAESLASENASRLAAMQRADKNIEALTEDLNRTFHRLRQSDIDEELFDVISGFEALRAEEKND